MEKTVGKFKIVDGSIYGPSQYMKDQGNEKLDKIMAGKDTVFNMSVELSPDIETGILVAMQTDYAAWAGMQQTLAWIK